MHTIFDNGIVTHGNASKIKLSAAKGTQNFILNFSEREYLFFGGIQKLHCVHKTDILVSIS